MRFIVSQLSDNQYISFALVFDVAYCHSLIDSKTMCALVVVIANGTAASVFNITAVVRLSKLKHATIVYFSMVSGKHQTTVMETK